MLTKKWFIGVGILFLALYGVFRSDLLVSEPSVSQAQREKPGMAKVTEPPGEDALAASTGSPQAGQKASPKSPSRKASVVANDNAWKGQRDGKAWLAIPGWTQLSPMEKLIRLIDEPFGVRDRGTVVVLELAKDELYRNDIENPKKRLVSIPLQASARELLKTAEEMGTKVGTLPRLVFYLKGTPGRTESTRRILSDEVLLQTADPNAAIASARGHGVDKLEAIEGVDGFIVGRDHRFPGAALVAAADLDGKFGITEVRPMLALQQNPRLALNDPLFSLQWHLKNSTAIHVNASSVWDTNLGNAVTVGIIDDGLQITHPDLSPNVDTSTPTLHNDYVGGDSDPSPFAPVDSPSTSHNEAEDGDCHGTAVGGLVGARGNNSLGVSGVAPSVKLVGLRLTAGPSTPSQESSAFGRRNDVIMVKNNSWGPSDIQPWVLGWADPVVQAAFANGATTGRGGLGTIYTFAGGNGRQYSDQSNKDGYANNMYTFAIAALTKSGVPAVYSEYGTNIIASAPADGVTTTDLVGNAGYNPTQESTPISARDYTDEFNGTSAACPVASGVIALILQANPNLGWRDVKEILLRSGRKVSATDVEWVSRTGGNPALPVIKHNPKYGGGMVDAGAATAMAVGWTNLGPLSSLSRSNTTGTAIPDVSPTGITKTFDFSSLTPTRVEMVEVEVDIDHTFRGDLEISLVSPSGTTSKLATVTDADDGFEDGLPKSSRGYHGWVFTSVRHWGESSLGVWKLVIKDMAGGDTGTFNSATVTLHGTSAPPVTISAVSPEAFILGGDSHTMTVTDSGHPVITHQWTRNGTPITGATGASYSIASAKTTDAGVYVVTAKNVTGSDSRTVNLAVAQGPAPSVIANVDKNLSLSVVAKGIAGQTFTYKWFKDGNPVVNDPVGPLARISGADKATLNILHAAAGDAGIYKCEVETGVFLKTTPDCNVTIRFKPDILTTNFPNDLIVSREVNIPLNIANGTTSVVIKGLPSGLTYDKINGTIKGTPSAPVTGQLITIIATNQAGTTTTTVPLQLTIAALQEKVQGTFNGLVSRNAHSQGGSNYGGKISNLVISKTGSYTGKLYLAQSAYTVTGRLISQVGGSATGSYVITRARPLPQMKLSFSIDPADGHLLGTLEEKPAVSPATWTTDVEAWRNPFSTTLPNTGLLGYHNVWMDSPSTDAAVAPQGAGTAAINLSKTGGASISVKLADGTTVTGSTTIGTTGAVPLFNMLYLSRGSLHGWVSVTDNAPPAFNTSTGTLTWYKIPISNDRKYGAGINFGVGNLLALTATGGEYVKPATSVPATYLWGIPDVDKTLTNAKLKFTGTAVEGNNAVMPVVPAAAMLADANTAVRISASTTATVPLPNLAGVKLSINATTGAFSGTVVLQDGAPAVKRTVTYSGLVVSGQQKGRGWFTVVRVPLSGETLLTAPIHSGAVELLPP